MTHKIIATDEQMRLINAAINESETYIQVIARRVGTLKGAEKDQALPEFVRIAAQLPEMTYTRYESMLARAVGLTTMELRKQIKVAKKEGDKSEDGEDVECTLGGYIDGYVVEYLYDSDDDTASLAWRTPDGKLEAGTSISISQKKYMAMMPNETIRRGAILFPAKLGELRDTKTLAAMIESFVKRVYLLPTPLYAKIISYYVLLTWMYDSFPAIPYLRVTGEPGSGKSELMLRIALLCYRRFVAGGASSTASLFRMVDKYKGTLFMDEMDLQKSDASADMIKLLVQGSMRDGAPIIRCEETMIDGVKVIQEIIFPVYCPKLLSMQGEFYDKAVASRCITFPLQARETYELIDAGIPLSINEPMRREAQAMRNLLLAWRLKHWQPNIEIDPDFYNLNISARLNQVTVAIQMIAEDDEPLRQEINQFMEEYQRYMTQDKNMTIEARIIEAIWVIYKFRGASMVDREADGREKIKIGYVTDMANKIIKAMNMESDEDDQTAKKKDLLSPQKVGHRLREKLQMETSPRSRDGYSVYWDLRHMEALSKRYGVTPNDLTDPDEGKNILPTAQVNLGKPIPTAKQEELPAENSDGER
jgi:hypothetical protein